MAERQVTIPRIGTITAQPTFRIIGSMNPYDHVGTTRLSTSVHDRFNRLVVGYQDARSEQQIVALRTGMGPDGGADVPVDLACALVEDAVALTRATRGREDTRQGSSVRGAIDLALVAAQLMALHGIDSPGEGRVTVEEDDRRRYAQAVLDAALVALSGRIHVDESAGTTPERVLREIWEDHFILHPAAAEPG